jgi:chloramphenicol-sensitive protein RarD
MPIHLAHASLASRYLPFVIFGLLSYLEPVLLAGASVAMGERIEAGEWFTYIPIWFAVLLLIIEGVLHLYKQQQNKKQLERNIEHLEKQQHSD